MTASHLQVSRLAPGVRWRLRPLPLALLGLGLLAWAVRLYALWDVPRFTDETVEAGIGLAILRGESWPLTNRDPYIGALWNYLLAMAFSLTGPSLYTPRAVVALFGMATVFPAWALARSVAAARPAMADAVGVTPYAELAGSVAALFLALAPAHIVVNSHIAWSNCITPFFTTLGLWLTHRSISQERPRLLPWAGLAWGLAAQTHPTAVLLLPGVAAAVALARPGWLWSPWPWLAVGAGALGAGNLILANAINGFQGVLFGGAVQAHYTGGEVLTWMLYLERLRLCLWLLTDGLGGVLSETGALAGPLARPAGLVILVVAACGIESLARRRDHLLLMASLSFVLLLPVANGRFEAAVPKVRYITPLLPICFAGIGVVVAQMMDQLGRPGLPEAAPLPHARRRRLALQAAALLATVGLLLPPLAGMNDYLSAARRGGRTNATYFQVVRAILASHQPGEPVYVERGVLNAYTLGGGQWREHLAFAAAVYGWDRQTFESPNLQARTVRRVVGPLVARRDTAQVIGQLYRINTVAESPNGASPIRVVYVRGPQPNLATAERQDQRDDIPQPPRPPRVEPFVSNVSYPLGLQFAPDGRLFFGEQRLGHVRIANENGVLQPGPFASLRVPPGRDQGILGLALDPAFSENRWVYVFYSEADDAGRPLRNRLVRFTEQAGLATDQLVILDNLPINDTGAFSGGHNGGRIAFGPDGKLYVSIGEVVRRSQAPNPASQIGKILRIERDGSIPADNPYHGLPAYAVGFQNVTGLAFYATAGQLYALDSSSEGRDELNLVRRGGNYGFPGVEGGPGGGADTDDPLWDSGEERLGVSGLTLYTGARFPEYQGDLFLCSTVTGALRRVRLSGPARDVVDWVETIGRDCRLDVVTGPDGTLYFSDLTQVMRLVR